MTGPVQAKQQHDADGCLCQGCGSEYHSDLLVPDEVWAKISPRALDGNHTGGLLCPTCIMDRITDAGIWSAGFAVSAHAPNGYRTAGIQHTTAGQPGNEDQ